MPHPASNHPASVGPAPSPSTPSHDIRTVQRRGQHRSWRANGLQITALLLAWLAITFIPAYFARDLVFSFLGWPFSFWMAAYGAPFAYLIIIGLYAVLRNRADRAARDQTGGGD
ncbi:FIG152265: Sodium:solute symporter associated protein [plant metagenome]|uniref:FIG152265: Sodium:solute symporter associated protein n=1 Tax=plant metagenome TaxID=1297885 RepID=A0A484TBX9_9ZZZZ